MAASLGPGAAFDYEPSLSPAQLAASAAVVFRTRAVSTIEIGDAWNTVTVDQVDVIADNREDPQPITQFGSFGAGVEDRPDVDASVLERLTVLVFAHHSPDAPGQLSADIEGLWVQCADEPPISVVVGPEGEAWHEATDSIDALIAATEEPSPASDVVIQADQGDGWLLVEAKPGYGQSHEVAIMTSERALDRAADARWFETRPRPDFDDEVVIVLAPAVSGSCPGIVFDGLTISDSQVFGNFAPGPPPLGTDTCTSDANPVSFVFVVQRSVLPERFILSVEKDVVCQGCEQATIDVDLSNEAELETALWGVGTLDIVIDGTPPGDGIANVVRWDPEGALLLSADEFTDLPRWIQRFDSNEPQTIEGFAVHCGDSACPEECDDRSCQDLQPLTAICSYEYEPEQFTDYTVIITWNGTQCAITAQPGQTSS